MRLLRKSYHHHLFCLDFSEVTVERDSFMLMKGAVSWERLRTPVGPCYSSLGLSAPYLSESVKGMSKDCCVLVSEVLTRGGMPKQGMQVSRPTHLRYWVSHCWHDPFWFSYLLLNVCLIFQESGILAVLFERQCFITCMNTRAFEFHILTCLSPFAHVQWPWLPMGQW